MIWGYHHFRKPPYGPGHAISRWYFHCNGSGRLTLRPTVFPMTMTWNSPKSVKWWFWSSPPFIISSFLGLAKDIILPTTKKQQAGLTTRTRSTWSINIWNQVSGFVWKIHCLSKKKIPGYCTIYGRNSANQLTWKISHVCLGRWWSARHHPHAAAGSGGMARGHAVVLKVTVGKVRQVK